MKNIGKIMSFKYWISGCALLSITCGAQATTKVPQPSFPETEIYLFDLDYTDGIYSLAEMKNISNNKGYDNQPYFTDSDQTILFTSARDGKQTDIFEYDISSAQTTQMTDTPHSEFSPMSFDSNRSITYVNEGDMPDQSVWKLDRETQQNSWLINTKEPVGYYAADASSGNVVIWSRYGWNVQYLNTKRNEVRFITDNAQPITPQKIPHSRKFSFVHRQGNNQVWIKSFDPRSHSITPIAPIYGDNQNYAWTREGHLLTFENNQLFTWNTKSADKRWIAGQNLSDNFKGKLSRLTVSHDGKRIAVVENH